MSAKKKIVLGIIGCGGRIGRVHTKNIVSNFPSVKLKLFCDTNVKGTKEWAKSLGIKDITANYKEILEDSEINTVLICSPAPTHVDYIIKAADAGKDIFCEKPIDLDPKKIRKALEVVKKNDVKLQIGFMKRFDRNYMKLKESINSGKVGKLYLIKLSSRDPCVAPLEYLKSSGGIFLDMTCHDFDLVRYLTGNEIEEVFTFGSVLIDPNIGKIGDFDTVVVSLKFRNGTLGIIDNSRETNYGYDQRVEIFGSKGCISVDNPKLNQISFSAEEKIIIDNPNYWFFERYSNAYIEEMRYFFKAIQNNTEPLVTGVDALKAVLIGLAVQKSAKENKTIEVEYSMD